MYYRSVKRMGNISILFLIILFVMRTYGDQVDTGTMSTNITTTIKNTKAEQLLLQDIIMPQDYNKKYYNTSLPDPTLGLKIVVDSLTILESEQKCNVTIQVAVSWTDYRLQFRENSSVSKRYRKAPHVALQEFWHPKTTLSYRTSITSLWGHRVPLTNNDTEIGWKRWNHPDCKNCVRLWTKAKMNLLIHSHIEYKFFPNDKHFCEILAQPGYVGSDSPIPVKFPWTEVKSGFTSDPVFDNRVSSTAFTLALLHKNMTEFDYQFLFNRRLENYIYQIYVPSGLFVVLGWISMLLPAEIASERVGLCATALLTSITFFNTARQTGPTVTYLRALDIWLLGSIGFVFLILFQSILVLRITGKKLNLWGKLTETRTKTMEHTLKSLKLQFEKLTKGEGERCRETPESGLVRDSLVVGVHILEEPNNPQIIDSAKEEMDDENKEKLDRQRALRLARIFDIVSTIVIAMLVLVSKVIYWEWLLNTVQQVCWHDHKCAERLVDTFEFSDAQEEEYIDDY